MNSRNRGMKVDSYYQRYRDKGFKFSDDILTSYALSLVTKPFVILSGISGTGKSKIAQLFKIPSLDREGAAGENEKQVEAEPVPRGFVTLNLSKKFFEGADRANFRYADVAVVLSQADAKDVEQKKKDWVDNMRGEGNFSDEYEVTIDTQDPAEQQIKIHVYCQRASSPLLRIRFKSRQGECPAWNSFDFFNRNYTAGDVVRLERVGDRHLAIVATDAEARDAAQEDREREIRDLETQCFVAVRSNWVDSTELVGYYNQLTGEYQMTKVLRFMLQASDYQEVPHFLILDEMNLSKVEHYFSDFLSCIESRRTSDGQIHQEPITLHMGNSVLSTNDEYYQEIAPEIEVPTNLFVTGTVNVDDSTHMFSPKVLDRANVIELNEVHLGEMGDRGLRLKTFPDYSGTKLPSIDQLENVPGFVKDVLVKLLEVLSPQKMHFGYRTIAEISCFIENAILYLGRPKEESAQQALDIQLLQKVLPKFNGSAAKLDYSLRALIHCLSDSEVNLDEFGRSEILKLNASATKFPRSLSKAKHMYLRLVEQGFVSFIE